MTGFWGLDGRTRLCYNEDHNRQTRIIIILLKKRVVTDMDGTTEQTATFRTDDGLDIFYRWKTADPERGRVVIAHGLGEHSGRYAQVMERLTALGLSVWALDHRGHGQSGGHRGHVNSFDQYLTDLENLMALAAREKPAGGKLFLFGHSMGGLIAVRYAQEHPGAMDGLAVSSPALGMVIEVSGLKLTMARIMSRIWPGLTLNNELNPNHISHDPGTVQRYQEDPLVHAKITARWTMEFFQAIQTANDRVAEITVPCSMQVAGDDHLVSAPASKAFFNRLTVEDKTLHFYDGFYHENFNETPERREKALDDFETWLTTHL